MFAHRNRILSLVIAAVIAISATTSAQAATIGSRFDPNDVASIQAALTPTTTLVFDTNALTVDIDGGGAMAGGVAVASVSGDVEMAMFNFGSVSIPSGVTVTVTGDRGLVLGSLGSITLGSTIDVSGTDGVGNAKGFGGPGAEGGVRDTSFNSAPPPSDAGNGQSNGTGKGFGAGRKNGKRGEGASYGGIGAVAGVDVTYGDETLTELYGGSGGGGGNGGGGNSAGGGGGGTVELTALDTITISLTGSLLAAGGKGGNRTGGTQTRRGAGGASGGGILINAPTVLLDVGSLLDASGGNHGDGRNNLDGGGGSGGRIAIYANDLTQLGTIDLTGGTKGNNSFSTPQVGTSFSDVFSTPTAPEPSTAMLAMLGMIGLVFTRRRRR